MSVLEHKSLERPDEVRPFKGHGHMDVVNLESGVVGRGVFEPGWHWADDVGPIAGTASCQAPHLGYVMSGRMRVRMDGGEEMEIGPGEAVDIPPGHDAWVVGDEACVMVDFAGAAHYATP
jgi:hypothetical protein